MRSLLLLSAILLAAPACKKKSSTAVRAPVSTSVDRPAGDRATTDDRGSADVVANAPDGSGTFAPIYFEFDSVTLDQAARAELERLAEWMQAHPGAQVTIEGHADERGTTEYNVALGQRRAQAIEDYLVRLGVPAARLETLSFGEERPAVAGSSEDAFAKNRRGELVPRD